MRALLLLLCLSSPALAEPLGVAAAGGLRWAERGGLAPAFAVELELPLGLVAPFAGVEVAQLHRSDEVQGTPFSLLVREAALVAGVTVQRGRPFARAGVRLAAQAIRSSTVDATEHDLGVSLGGELAVGWSWPQGFTLAVEVVLDPLASRLTGDTTVFAVGPRAGYRWGASRR